MERAVTISVNGVSHTTGVEPRTLLVHFLREHLNLTGTHVGCDTSNCGACTVWLDGLAVKSCTVLAVQADGTDLTTIEGISESGELHPMQRAFHETHGLQCGYCTPGMVMTAIKLLEDNQDWAVVGAAAVVDGSSARIALTGVASTPMRAGAAEAAFTGSNAAAAAAHAAEGLDPPSDTAASGEYRAHLARVLVRRALEAAMAR